MTDHRPPPGWYLDPTGDDRLRWWDGTRWTDAARDRDATNDGGGSADARAVRLATIQRRTAARRETRTAARAWPRRQLIAGAVLGGFLLVTLGAVAALVIADRSPGDVPAIDEVPHATDADDTARSDAQEAAGADDPPTGSDDEPAGTGGDGGTGDDAEASDATADDADSDDVDAPESIEVDFDGVCAAQVDLDDPAIPEDPEALRPWHVEACPHAPVALDDGPRWIVVVASITGTMPPGDAQTTADDAGLGLLHSSHYPSLNPDLWVVYDGPYAGEQDAADAAARIGGGAYPRLLSDDEGDRYCVLADGCVGADLS